MLQELRDQVDEPQFYSSFAYNCVFWSVGAVFIGLQSEAENEAEFEALLPDLDHPLNAVDGPVTEEEYQEFLDSLSPEDLAELEQLEQAALEDEVQSSLP